MDVVSATSQKVSVSRPNEVNAFFSIYLILLAALGLGVHSASNRNEYWKQKNNASEE
jgi:energy-converting hydrogenase Eha subunit F